MADTLALELAAKIPGRYETKVGAAIRPEPEPVGTVHLALESVDPVGVPQRVHHGEMARF